MSPPDVPATCVQVRHDDGAWYEGELLAQHRLGGRWRAVVRYSVAPGMRYERGEWADDLRRCMDHQRDEDHHQGDGPARASQQDGKAQAVAWIVPHGRRA